MIFIERPEMSNLLEKIRSCPELGLALLQIAKGMIPMYDAWGMTGANGHGVTEVNSRAAKYRKLINDIETVAAFTTATDPAIPPGEIQFRDDGGNVVGKITGLSNANTAGNRNGLAE